MNAAPRMGAPAAAGALPPVPEQLAAIDLGSNSFHLVIGRVVDGHVDIVDRLREPVRLAAVLNRARADDFLPGVAALAKGESLSVAFPPGWLDAHPFTRADLEQEQAYLDAVGVGLRFA